MKKDGELGLRELRQRLLVALPSPIPHPTHTAKYLLFLLLWKYLFGWIHGLHCSTHNHVSRF